MVGIFQSFWHEGKKSYILEHFLVVASVLLLSASISLLFFKNKIPDVSK